MAEPQATESHNTKNKPTWVLRHV